MLSVCKGMLGGVKEEFDKSGLIMEDTIQATHQVDALDRASVLNIMDKLGLKNMSEYYNFALVHTVNKICNACNVEITVLVYQKNYLK